MARTAKEAQSWATGTELVYKPKKGFAREGLEVGDRVVVVDQGHVGVILSPGKGEGGIRLTHEWAARLFKRAKPVSVSPFAGLADALRNIDYRASRDEVAGIVEKARFRSGGIVDDRRTHTFKNPFKMFGNSFGPVSPYAYGQLPEELQGIRFAAALKRASSSEPSSLTPTPGYERLVAVLKAAHDQAATGKGLDRHANDLPFDKQRMQQISQLLDSPDGMAYQVCKKVAEGLGLPEHDRQVAELLGAINYIAGIVIFLEDKRG